MKDIGDFLRSRKNGIIYWITEIDYNTKMYTLEYIIKAGNGFEDDEKRTIGFSFDEINNNFDEEKIHTIKEFYCEEGGDIIE